MTMQPTGNVRTCPEIIVDSATHAGDIPARMCGKPLVRVQSGDGEVVYGCPEHGWQATLFEDGGNL